MENRKTDTGNKNISYPEARKLIVPQLSQTYAEAANSSTINNSTQTDENITKIKCPPLKLLPPLSSIPKPNISTSTPVVSTSSSSTQDQLLPSTSSIAGTVSEPQPPIPTSNDAPSTNDMFTRIESSSSITRFLIQLRYLTTLCIYNNTGFQTKCKNSCKKKKKGITEKN
ncbi:uncharacterized protein TNCV_490661 [Trichonephila clavipes]|nr:uncharacterized protein TNCV_490661 [Trichonephila clavipes]